MIKKIKYSLVFSVLIILSCLIFIVSTESGLRLVLTAAKKISQQAFQYQTASGRLLTQWRITNLSYQTPSINFHTKLLSIDLAPLALLRGQLTIKQLRIKDSQLSLHSATKKTTTSKRNSHQPPFSLPFSLQVRRLSATSLALKLDQQHYAIEQLTSAFNIKNNTLKLEQFIVNTRHTHLHAQANVSLAPPYQADLSLKSQGNLKGHLFIQGNLSKWHITGHFSHPYLLDIKGQINPGSTGRLKAKLTTQWKKLYWPLQGPQHLHSPSGQLNLMGHFSLQPQLNWQGQLNIINTSVHNNRYHLTKLNAQLDSKGTELEQTFLSQNKFTIASAKLAGLALKGELLLDHPHTLKGHISLGSNHLRINGPSLDAINATVKLNDYHRLFPTLKPLHATLDGSVHIAKDITATLRLSPGHYQFNQANALHFKQGQIRATLNKQHLTAKAHFAIDRNKTLKATLTASPDWDIPFTQWPLTLDNQLSINSLNFIDTINPYTQNTAGRLQGSLKVKGSINHPILTTQLTVKGAKTTLPQLGTTLSPINAALQGSLKQWQLSGSIGSKTGQLTFKGRGNYQNKQINTKVLLTGSNFLLLDLPDYTVEITPKLNVTTKANTLDVRGKITVPKATIQSTDFASTDSLPSDVIITSKETSTDSPLKLSYQLNAKLGNDVTIKALGLSGKLQGELALMQRLNQASRANGTLAIKQGKYDAYGQRLTINKGELTYTGGLLSQPGINLRASREFITNSSSQPDYSAHLANESINNADGKMSIGINVSGRLRAPKITLFSNPSGHSQADILSMLVLGRPSSQSSLSQSDSKLLLTALSSLSLVGDNPQKPITQQVQQALGLDSLSIETFSHYDKDSNTTSDSTALLVSKSLSKRLSLQYGVGLSDSGFLLRAIYHLNHNWSVQLETNNEASGIDLSYKRWRN